MTAAILTSDPFSPERANPNIPTDESRVTLVVRDLLCVVQTGGNFFTIHAAEQPHTGWTFYGNQVERRLF